MMRVEKWCGHDIRFVEVGGEWYAMLDDICNALVMDISDVKNGLLNESWMSIPEGIIVDGGGIIEIIFGIKTDSTEAFRRQAYNDTRRIFDKLNR